MSVNLQLRVFKTQAICRHFVNAVGCHNKYLFGSLEVNIITGRALAKTTYVRGGGYLGGGQG